MQLLFIFKLIRNLIKMTKVILHKEHLSFLYFLILKEQLTLKHKVWMRDSILIFYIIKVFCYSIFFVKDTNLENYF